MGNGPGLPEPPRPRCSSAPHCSGPRTLIQEFEEKRTGAAVVRRDLVAYFRLLTWAWTLYFLAKTAAYLWLARAYGLEQGC